MQKAISNTEKLSLTEDLNVGDYIVHVHHGVGRYLGVETLEVGANMLIILNCNIKVRINYLLHESKWIKFKICSFGR